MTATSEPPIRVFLSYARDDDFVLGLVEPFTRDLANFARADRGRSLEIFVDRDSIGWGDDWREAIRAGVEGAMVFLPVITRRYFQRPWCRDELFQFHSASRQRNVGALLLPVVVLGRDHIRPDSEDPAVRIVDQRQCRDLGDAWADGNDSPTWRRTVLRLARELVDAVEQAEQRLAAEPPDGAAVPTDVGAALRRLEQESGGLAWSIREPLDAFTAVLAKAGDLTARGGRQADRSQRLIDVAAELQPHADRFLTGAREFDATVVETDELVRDYLRHLHDEGLTAQLARERASFAVTGEDVAALAQLDEMAGKVFIDIRPLEIASAPLRRAVRGFREGALYLTDALTVMRGWLDPVDQVQ